MRILHVTDHYLPVLGGIETHVSSLARRQARRGDEVTVLTSTPAFADGRLVVDDPDDADNGDRADRADRADNPVKVRRSSLPAGFLADFATFDVVHAHVSVVAPFTAPVIAVAARSGAPTVVTVHSLWNGLGPAPELFARLTGLRGAPVSWTAVSEVAAGELAQRLPAQTKVGVLPNAVEVAARPASPEPAGDRAVRLVSTMRVARRKRPLALLEMYAALRRTTNVPTELTIVGDGPLRPRVERVARRLGLGDCVSVTGRLEPPEVLAELAKADVYVAPALLESFGIAALEARCVGLPVVGYVTTGMSEFVGHAVEGFLCRDDADMVSRLRELCADEELRLQMSEHNRTTPSPMTWQRALQRHDAVYDEVRAGHRPSRRPSRAVAGGRGFSR
jgi:glycosyltransferase involved in cell wall biosynthesis